MRRFQSSTLCSTLNKKESDNSYWIDKSNFKNTQKELKHFKVKSGVEVGTSRCILVAVVVAA